MESFNVYLPMDRRVALSKGESLPDRTRGAVLFADVSGFTPLTELLVLKLGRERGAEEMTFHLNRVYDAIIGRVDLYSGSVISFAGDAITCWFDGDDGRRALTCAFAIQAAMAEFKSVQTAGGIASFSIKASIVAGDVRRFLVGNPRVRSIETLAGRLMDRVASGENVAKQGEVIVGAEVVRNLHLEDSVAEWRMAANAEQYALIGALKKPAPESPWESTPIIPTEQSRDWLLPALYERLNGGGEDYLAELRPAVALFLKFTGIDYDSDEAGDLLDRYVRWAQSVVAHYEGNLIELAIGDKGSSLYMIFGAPQAHEDDAARAAGAALELLKLPDELKYIHTPQMGISLGLMRTGSYGSQTRRSYGAQGPQVNLANRLMSKAQPGQILVSQVAMEAARRKYDFEYFGDITLKGVAQPVPVYSLKGPARVKSVAAVLQRHQHTSICGRDKERDYVAKQLEALRDGAVTPFIVVQGEAGIGKSRLVAELVDLAGASSIPSWMGVGDAVEHSTPYLAWRPVLARYFDLDTITEIVDGAEIESARQQVASYLEDVDPALVPLAPLLNVFLPLQFQDNDITSQLNGEVRANQTHNLCLTLFKYATTKSPHVLIIEDAHWLDSSSWSLLNQVSSAVPSLMTVIAMRPPSEPVSPDLTRLLERPNVYTLSLDSMSAAEIETLVCSRLDASSLPPEVSRFINERADGNPFFSEELAYALRDTGLIRIVNRKCELSPDAGDLKHLNFPDTIDGVIISRIDALAPQEQLALKVASVIGRIFALRTLRDIHPVAADRTLLSDYLDHLRSLDITPLEALEPDQSYIFRHIITHEVAYNLLLFQQRRDLHRLVADWYERVFGEDLSPHYPLLAYHWRIAEDPAKQIKYLELSGEHALRNGAYREAIVFFQELIALNEKSKLIEDSIRIAHWERALGESYFSAADFSKSRHYHLLAVKRLGRPFSASGPGLIFQLLGEAVRQVMHRYFPSRFVGTVTDPARVERYLEGARAYERISHIVYFENNTFGTVAAGIASLNLSERVAASPESVRAYGTTQVTTGLLGMHNASLSYERLAKESSDAVRGKPGFLAAEGWRLMMVGTYHAGAGSLQKAIEAMGAAIEIWEKLGEKQRWKESLSLVATMNVYYSDLATARRRIDQFYQAALQEGNEQFRFWALLTRAMVYRREGNLDDAQAALKDAVSSGIVLAASDQIWHGGVLARVLLGLGQFDLAEKEADKAAHLIAASQPTAYYVFTSYSAVIEVYLAGMQQDADRLKDYQTRAWKIIGKLKAFSTPFPIARARLNLLLARYYALSGKRAAIKPALQVSLAAAEKFHLKYDRALAYLELSNYMSEVAVRKKYREVAKALFTESGAVSEAERVVVE